MKKFILGLAIVLTAMIATPALAVEECEQGYALNSEGECMRIMGGAPMFHFPRIQERFYHYGNILGFLGNKNTVGHLFIGKESVPFARNEYGNPLTAMLFNGSMPFLTANPLSHYDYELVDQGAVYHAFPTPEWLGSGHYFVRGCIDSIFGLSCGVEYEIDL